MASKPQKPEAVLPRQAGNEEPLDSIENLREKHGISLSVFAGACAANGWKPGKALTEKNFLNGITAFSGLAMNGHPRREKEKKHA